MVIVLETPGHGTGVTLVLIDERSMFDMERLHGEAGSQKAIQRSDLLSEQINLVAVQGSLISSKGSHPND